MRDLLENLVEECRQYTGNGNLASYIPELFKYKCAKVDGLEKLLNSPTKLVKYYLKRVKAKLK